MSTEQGSQVTDSAATETADVSLRDTLEKNIEASENGGTVDVSDAARTLAGARKSGQETTEADSTGAENTADKPGTEKTSAETTEKTEAATTEALEAPTHWPAADREMFGKQTPEAKQFILNRHKAMEADYTRKTQELAPVRRFKEQMDEIMGPYREAMAREGIDDAMAIKQLVAAHAYLQRDPANAIQWLADKYGIDLKAAGTAGTEAGQPSAELVAVKKELAELKNSLSAREKQEQDTQHQATLSQITQFAEAKDAQGQLKHPHFDDVAPDVAALIRAARAQGQTLTLQDAYDRAVYANPQTRTKVLAAQDAQRKAKEEEERKAKLNAAKKAGTDVSGTGAATAVVANPNDLRATLEANLDKAEGRV
jgi:hypothetical protein